MRPVLRKGIGPFLCILLAWLGCNASKAAWASDSSLRIASFNIQIFGQSKMKKAPVVSTLLKILDRYDLVFIQEIRDSEETAIFDLLDRLNKQSSKNYQIIVSERLGRSSSKEQYAYLFNIDKVVPVQYYVHPDTKNEFEREPYVAHFKTSNDEFTMIGLHATPTDVKAELRALPAVYTEAKQKFASKNIYVVGDLNADCSYYQEEEGFDYFPDPVTSMLTDSADTTVAKTDCAYDRVLAFGQLPRISSPALPFNFHTSYQLSLTEAQDVSDHYPVEWTFDSSASASGPLPSFDAVLPVPPMTKIPSKPSLPFPETGGRCGLNPTPTPGGYCYAELANGRRRVANACCPL